MFSGTGQGRTVIYKLQNFALIVLLCACAGKADKNEIDWLDWPQTSEDAPLQTHYNKPSGDAYFLTAKLSDIGDVMVDGMASLGTSPEDILRNAMSALWIDIRDFEAGLVRQADGKIIYTGDAETAAGSRVIVSTLTGTQPHDQIYVFIGTASEFEKEEAVKNIIHLAGTLDQPKEKFEPEQTQLKTRPEVQMPPSQGWPRRIIDANGRITIVGWSMDKVAYHAPDGRTKVRYVDYSRSKVSPRDAFKKELDALNLRVSGKPVIEEIDRYTEVSKNRGWVIAAKTSKGRAISFVTEEKDDRLHIQTLTANKGDWEKIGGVATAIHLMNIFEYDQLTDEFRSKSGYGSIKDDVQIFEAHVDVLIDSLWNTALSTMTMIHSSTMNTLQQMNRDISTETSCIMTTGCQIGIGAGGEKVMTFP